MQSLSSRADASGRDTLISEVCLAFFSPNYYWKAIVCGNDCDWRLEMFQEPNLEIILKIYQRIVICLSVFKMIIELDVRRI
jgi:hypothetical protein